MSARASALAAGLAFWIGATAIQARADCDLEAIEKLLELGFSTDQVVVLCRPGVGAAAGPSVPAQPAAKAPPATAALPAASLSPEAMQAEILRIERETAELERQIASLEQQAAKCRADFQRMAQDNVERMGTETSPGLPGVAAIAGLATCSGQDRMVISLRARSRANSDMAQSLRRRLAGSGG